VCGGDPPSVVWYIRAQNRAEHAKASNLPNSFLLFKDSPASSWTFFVHAESSLVYSHTYDNGRIEETSWHRPLKFDWFLPQATPQVKYPTQCTERRMLVENQPSQTIRFVLCCKKQLSDAGSISLYHGQHITPVQAETWRTTLYFPFHAL